ncbi:MAG: hypothetical protein LAO20_22320 [Acidobacteriia bacterium]|nr:hypothetical protein [Terriglobia bacterium]
MLATALSTISGVGFFQDAIQGSYRPEELADECIEMSLQRSKFALQLILINRFQTSTGMSVRDKPLYQLHPLIYQWEKNLLPIFVFWCNRFYHPPRPSAAVFGDLSLKPYNGLNLPEYLVGDCYLRSCSVQTPILLTGQSRGQFSPVQPVLRPQFYKRRKVSRHFHALYFGVRNNVRDAIANISRGMTNEIVPSRKCWIIKQAYRSSVHFSELRRSFAEPSGNTFLIGAHDLVIIKSRSGMASRDASFLAISVILAILAISYPTVLFNCPHAA